MWVSDISFVDFGKLYLRFNEKKGCWNGWVVFNWKHFFQYEIKDAHYQIFYEFDKQNMNLRPAEKQERKRLFKLFSTQKDREKDMQSAFKKMIAFLRYLEKVKDINSLEFEFKKNKLVHHNNNGRDYYREIILKGFPLKFSFHWDLLDENDDLFFLVEPLFKKDKSLMEISSSSLASYFGESFVRKLWIEAIKEDKQRLRLMNCKIRT